MAAPVIDTSFAAGEISPSLFGHVDLARFHVSAATMRNCFVSYRGGAYSRAGTAFAGISKQTGRNFPPRLIPFQFSISQGLVLEFGHLYMRVVQNGALVTETPLVVTNITRANPAVVTSAAHGYSNGDWVAMTGTQRIIGGNTFVVGNVTANTFQIYDVYGVAINTAGAAPFPGGTTAARVYTLATPWAEQDLGYLKYVQSADTMSLCCVNPDTGAEYVPRDLSRIANNNWTLVSFTSAQTIHPPTAVSGISSATSASQGTSTSGGTVTTYDLPTTTNYAYVVTSVGSGKGNESVASRIAYIDNVLDMSATASSNILYWSTVDGAASYNVYKAMPGYTIPVAPGALFGFIGTSIGGSFTDSNVTPDFTQVPPTHKLPFARGAITSVTVTAPGTGYSSRTTTFSITTSTGSGAVLQPLCGSAGELLGVAVLQSGSGYAPGDTVAPVGGGGAGATATLSIGPQSGTYPAVPSYFQQRRVYASTLNNPGTYYMSQPGAFQNFDSRIPTIDSDAIIGTPWSVQVNGVQHLLPMPGGLVVLTGVGAWQVTGAGSYGTSAQAITPSSQQAQPQAYNGCSATVPPIKIDYDILYVQAKGSIYRDLSYNYFTNIYTGADLTQNSSHLFTGHTILSHAWCEEPNKVLWAVRDDGVLLSLTFLKAEQVTGWARHDTAGQFVAVCSVTETPVDALYLVAQRQISGSPTYMIERMDNRFWNRTEDAWCVDCGLTYTSNYPAATLYVSSPTGLGALATPAVVTGGTGYSSGTTVSIVDDNGRGPGTGGVITPTIASGVITALTLTTAGTNYVAPKLTFIDPAGTGSGATATVSLDNSATFQATGGFATANIGDVIRSGGGTAVVTTVTSADSVVAQITQPITLLVPNTTLVAPRPQDHWSIQTPVTVISGMRHLAGMSVVGLADGNPVGPLTVSANGTVTLPNPATVITLGLAFQAQFQSVYLDAGEPTVQGQRKKVAAATVRVEASRGLKMGANQRDGSTMTPPQLAPTWRDLQTVPDLEPAPFLGGPAPLYTGDVRIPLSGGYDTHGQICLQQDNPLPMQITALIPEVLAGDPPSQAFPRKDRQQR